MNPPPVPIITYMVLGFGVLMLVESFILSRVMLTKGILRIAQSTKNRPGTGAVDDETTDLCDLYQSRMIVTAASREGGTFFLLIAYLTEGTLSSLIGAIVLMAFIAAMFPTFTMVERWVEEQRELLQQQRLGI